MCLPHRAVTGCCGCPCAGSPDPDWCPSVPANQSFSRGSPPERNACPGHSPIFYRVPHLGGGGLRGEGGVRLVTSLRGGARPSSAPILPKDPNFPRGPPLGVVAYGVWGHILQTPVGGRLTIVECLMPPLSPGRIPPSRRRRNSRPSLSMIPISLLLCARPRGDGAGSATASNLFHVPSPIIPYGVIHSVCRDLIVFFVVVIIALKISMLHTLYHQLSPPNQKIVFFSFFARPI